MSGRGRLRLYRHLDARFDQSDEDPRASLVDQVDQAGAQGTLKTPQPVEKGRQIERPASGVTQDGSGYDRVGEVYRDPATGQLVLIEPVQTKNK